MFPVYNRVGLSRLSLTQASKVELELSEDLETVRVCTLMEALKKRRSRLSLKYCIEEPKVLRGILGYCIEFCIGVLGFAWGPEVYMGGSKILAEDPEILHGTLRYVIEP